MTRQFLGFISSLYLISSLITALIGGNVPVTFPTQPPHIQKANSLLFSLEPGISLNSLAFSGIKEATLITNDTLPIYRLDIPAGRSPEEAIQTLSALPGVAFVEKDAQANLTMSPDDPQFASQWGAARIGLETAWDWNTGSPSVIIAVLDSGVDLTHPELAGRIWTNPNEIPDNHVDDDGNGYVDDIHGWNVIDKNGNVQDSSNGHGSNVAGIIGANTNNAVGIAGACPNCLLLPVRVIQDTGVVNYSDIVAGLQYIDSVSPKPKVVNISLGGYADSASLKTWIQSISSTTLVVAGAGNDAKSAPFYPAAYPEVLSVAASASDDSLANFSNQGAWVKLSAPGADILTLGPDGAYVAKNGTSLSAAYVSGVAGLLFSQNPSWSPALIRAHLMNTAQPITGLPGSGLLQAGVALSTPPQPLIELSSWTLDGKTSGLPEPGGNHTLSLAINNKWIPGRSLTGTLSSTSPYVTISDNLGSFGDVNTGVSANNSLDPFTIQIAGGAPYNSDLPFHLAVSGADGYSYAFDFSINIRSGIETLSNTKYTSNRTWTADKTYVINGNIIVASGAALTIEPGTHIRLASGRNITVEGGIVARGTNTDPIVFEAVDPNAPWGSISLMDSAIGTRLNFDGSYASGSVFQFLNMSGSASAIKTNKPSILVEDCQFKQNTNAIALNSLSWIRRNQFTSNQTAIEILSGSGAEIKNNLFNQNGTAIQSRVSFVIIEGNEITGSTAGTLKFDNYPNFGSSIIMNNRIVSNAHNLTVSPQATVVGNLIANNTQSNQNILGISSSAGINIVSGSYGASNIGIQKTVYHPMIQQYQVFYTAGNILFLQALSNTGEPISYPKPIKVFESSFTFQVLPSATTENTFLTISTSNNSTYDLSNYVINPNGEIISQANITNLAVCRFFSSPEGNTGISLITFQSCSSSEFSENKSIYFQRIGTDGQPIGTPISSGITLGNSSSIVDVQFEPTYQRSWILYSEGSENKAILLPANGDPFSTISLGANGFSYYYEVHLTFTDGKAWIIWSSNSVMGARTIGINGSQLSNAQTLLTYINSSTANNGFSTSVLPDGTGLFLIWQEMQPISGNMNYSYQSTIKIAHLVNPSSGSFTLSDITEISGPNIAPTYSDIPPMMTSTGSEYLVSWLDSRFGASEVYGQRIASTGELIDCSWSIDNESQPKINYQLSNRGVHNNTIVNNQMNGVEVSNFSAPWTTGQQIKPRFWNNNILNNIGDYQLYLSNSTKDIVVDARGNWWGDIAEDQLINSIRDCTFDENGCGNSTSTIGEALYSPALSSADTEAPAFAESFTVQPDSVLGLQRGDFQVKFSRPMDSSQTPDLSFHNLKRGTQETIFTGSVVTAKEDTLHRIWVLAQNSGGTFYDLYHLENGSWVQITKENTPSLPGTEFFGMSVDNKGNLWILGKTLSSGANTYYYLAQVVGDSWNLFQIPYFLPSSNIFQVFRENDGNIWLRSANTLFAYQNGTWNIVSSDIPYQNLAMDSLGRLWGFKYSSTNLKLGYWSNSTFSEYSSAGGFSSIQSDSQGRIWVFRLNSPEDPSLLWLIDGDAVKTFNLSNFSGFYISQNIYEDSDGNILVMSTASATRQWFIYKNNGSWEPIITPFGKNYSPYYWDSQDNLWSLDSGKLNITWGGLNYPIVDDGHWVDERTYQASYSISPETPRGQYQIQASGAVDAAGMETAPTAGGSFTIDYAGAVTDGTPPSLPTTTLRCDGSLNTLILSWTSADPQGISRYRYAIGSAPGKTDLVSWTETTSTNVTLSGLLLAQGKNYYASVQAANRSGLWSPIGISNAAMGGEVTVLKTYIYLPAVQK